MARLGRAEEQTILEEPRSLAALLHELQETLAIQAISASHNNGRDP
jgi:hypothetical protein